MGTLKKVGYYQFNPVLGNPQMNREKVNSALKNIKADLIVLPELAFTGYSMDSRKEALELAEDVNNSPTIEMLENICRNNKTSIVAGFAEKYKDKIYNSAVLISPEGFKAVYRKMHLFGFESEFFDPGPSLPEVYDVDGLKIGMMVCYDWFFPETARIIALKGADIIAHPSNLVLPWCQRAMVTRCLENNIFAVTANRFGSEIRRGKELTFTGASQITAPRLEIVASASKDSEELTIVEIDINAARRKTVTKVNHLLNDRRSDLYGDFGVHF